jgi:A/G-specific adenine glycosylase
MVHAVMRWFYNQARDLPWRRTLDPYAIWVSEIMLQQTQVKTVIPYWERWMQRFPDIASLARAETDAVLKAWEGLGYYSRARNLQSAAQVLTRDHGARFPTGHAEVLNLPGIGPYTAGAVCSLAFNQPTPILDGNIERVLTRLGAVAGDPRARELRQELWRCAARWVEQAARQPAQFRPGLAGNCSALNQALMELGALICTPKAPRCSECPIARRCRAFQENATERYPELSKRAAVTARHFHAFVWQHKNAVWVVQRPSSAVNGGLWEFPNVEVTGQRERLPAAYARAAWGIICRDSIPLPVVRHSITRYRIELQAHQATVDDTVKRRLSAWSDSSSVSRTSRLDPTLTPSPWVRGEWVKPETALDKAFAAAHRRILRAWLNSIDERG